MFPFISGQRDWPRSIHSSARRAGASGTGSSRGMGQQGAGAPLSWKKVRFLPSAFSVYVAWKCSIQFHYQWWYKFLFLFMKSCSDSWGLVTFRPLFMCSTREELLAINAGESALLGQAFFSSAFLSGQMQFLWSRSRFK